VPRPLAAPVLRAPCGHRDFRPRDGSQRPGPSTVTRRLCTIAGFYRYAVEEEPLDHSPAAHVRRPRLDYESHATALDRNELGALLVAAGLGPAAEHALVSLLALNGRRLDRHGAVRVVRWVTRRAGIAKHVSPHTLRHAFITPVLDAGGAAARRAGSRLARRGLRVAPQPASDDPGNLVRAEAAGQGRRQSAAGGLHRLMTA
jgi:site-specific recombinase XerD